MPRVRIVTRSGAGIGGCLCQSNTGIDDLRLEPAGVVETTNDISETTTETFNGCSKENNKRHDDTWRDAVGI